MIPRCGDGVTDVNEECDDGPMNANGPNSCRVDCTKPTCGDGIVDFLYGEVCDQGARNSFTAIDGCSPKCTLNLCSQSVHFDLTLNPADLLPRSPGAYHYVGSLNSPPCTEGTEWFVFSSPAPISSCQLDQFRNVLHGNTRCLQATNGRTVDFLQETSVCGDGVVEGNEECDAGLMNSDALSDSCRKNCRKARCGDGVQDSNEQCDGTPNCNSLCVLDCNASTTRPPRNSTALTYGEDETVINVNFASILAQ
jgi:cysteine-rich repeat protein